MRDLSEQIHDSKRYLRLGMHLGNRLLVCHSHFSFFFSSRRRHTRCSRDWSSDVCSSDLRRLAIIDLSEAARQPMSTPDGRFHLSFNGEIYNYREIRAELKNLGHSFRTSSDAEVLLEGWRRWGKALLPRLIGMFEIGRASCRERV